MRIYFSEIPTEGLHRKGELPESIFSLQPSDPIRPCGPVHYEADIYALEEIVAISGRLHGKFQLQCGTCLEYFDYDADFPHWSAELDRTPEQDGFDLADLIREDFLLLLPSHVYCEDYVPGRVCPSAQLMDHLSTESEEPEEGGGGSSVWSALEDLDKR